MKIKIKKRNLKIAGISIAIIIILAITIGVLDMESTKKVKLETNKGDIIIELYDDMPITAGNFEGLLPKETLKRLNQLRDATDKKQLKKELPESFLQRRVIKLNYRAIRTIIMQREHHELEEWRAFCDHIKKKLIHKEYLS